MSLNKEKENNNEVFVDDNDVLVSTTDLKGRILYANEAFCRVAGYEEKEIIGRGHNIVRHSFMPKAAFEDLWNSIKQGKPWRGAVKNKCKDGSFYWVDAFVTPIKENNKIIGYQSVRKKLKPEYRNRAEKLYNNINKNKKDFSISKEFSSIFVLITMLSLNYLFQNLYASSFAIILSFVSMYLLYIKPHNENKELLQEYDSVSKFIFNKTPSNTALYHLKIKDGLIKTILGRVEDSSTILFNNKNKLVQIASNVYDNSKVTEDNIKNIKNSNQKINQSVDLVVDKIGENMDNIEKTNTVFKQAITSIDDNVQKVEKLTEEVESTSLIISETVESTQEIGSIIEDIKQISDQTNLLALNAAIEAARAGEAGRGFSVVADEVRKLSDRSKKSTEKIESSISFIIGVLEELSINSKNSEIITKECNEASELTKYNIQLLSDSFSDLKESSKIVLSLSGEQKNIAIEDSNAIEKLENSSIDLHNNIENLNNRLNKIEKSSNELKDLSKTF